MMSKLAQNVTPVGDPHYNRMQDQSGSSQISIAGGPVRGNNYLLDGIPITDALNRAMIIPTLEAVQEVKVQANTYDAEMARTGGGCSTPISNPALTSITAASSAACARPVGRPTTSSITPPASACPSSPTAPSAPASAASSACPSYTTGRTRPSSGWPGKATTTRSPTRRSLPLRPPSSVSATFPRRRPGAAGST